MSAFDEVARHFLFFMLYSFLGWVWESIFTSLWKNHHLINRGFLNGPYCPIYGCGALVNILLFDKVQSPVQLFLMSGAICCMIEYATSWAMEALFHARWWDYSGKLLNIHGRVCLLGFLGFASFSVVLLKLLHPAVNQMASGFHQNALYSASLSIFSIVLFDYIITLTGFHGFNDRLRALSASIESSSTDWIERMQLAPRLEAMNDAYRDVVFRLTRQQRRMIRAFPQLRSLRYDRTLRDIRSLLEKEIKREIL